MSFSVFSDRTQYICETCGKNFATRGNLKIHSVVHNRTLLKVCPVCNKRVSSIKKHMVTHSDDRPHICHVCGKSFKTKAALKVCFATFFMTLFALSHITTYIVTHYYLHCHTLLLTLSHITTYIIIHYYLHYHTLLLTLCYSITGTCFVSYLFNITEQ